MQSHLPLLFLLLQADSKTPGTFITAQTALILLCQQMWVAAFGRDPEEEAWDDPGQDRVPGPEKSQKATTQLRSGCLEGPRAPQEHPQTPKNTPEQSFQTLKDLPLIEHNDTCKAYESKNSYYSTQTQVEEDTYIR